MELAAGTVNFCRSLSYAAIPEAVRHQALRCLLDLIGVAAAGSTTSMAAHARTVACSQYGALPGQGARMLFADGQASASGAAMANAAALDSYDAHDGHVLTKGHAGATVLPALLAVLDAHKQQVSGAEFLATLVMGYELSLRAGIALHATAADYHSSGSWAALGAAAVCARRLELSESQFHEALGIAEYHGPRGPMMRCIDYPTMVKDSATWGAPAGVTAAYLAQQGFTGAPAELLHTQPTSELWSDLGRRWRMLDQYFKPYPVCRWAQPAIQAALALRKMEGFDASRIEAVQVQTFMQAFRLGKELPVNTERAQYSLGYPLACTLLRGCVGASELQPQSWEDPSIAAMLGRIHLVEDSEMSRRFPSERIACVTVRLDSGITLEQTSEVTLGDPATPLSDQALELKARDALLSVLRPTQVQPLLDRIWNFDATPDALLALAPLWGAPSLN